MTIKNKYKIAAVVDIGAEFVSMKITQTTGEKDMTMLENLMQNIDFGEDLYSLSKISFDKAEIISEILRKYYRLADEYKIPREYITTIATTQLRNAKNKDYIVDQISIKTDRPLSVLEDSEEKSMVFKEMLRRINLLTTSYKTYLMMYLGTDSVGISVVDDKEIIYYQHIKLESMKLSQMTDDIETLMMRDYIQVIDEYLHYITYMTEKELKSYSIDTIIVSGNQMDAILTQCSTDSINGYATLSKSKLNKFFEETKQKPLKKLEKIFNIDYQKSKTLLITLAFCSKLLEITGANQLLNLGVSLSDAMLYELLFKKQARINKKEFDQNMISSARYVAQKYNYDKKHSKKVEKFALTIFDNLKKVHGFSRRERLYLQTAAILHDVGRFINTKDYDLATANIIYSSSIISLTNAQKKIIANIARYHGKEVPTLAHETYASLTSSQKMIVSKLSAILRLADALDFAHLQKIDEIQLMLHEKKLTIIAIGNKNTTLEEWTFANAGSFFEQVFGIKCDVTKKGML